MAPGVVDDREASVNQGNIDDRAIGAYGTVAEAAVAVGSAVLDGVIEDVEPRLGDCDVVRRWGLARRMDFQDAGDAAHAGK
ncbi:MAG: hypothetical protein ACKVW3_14340 [Phycisphaerales bacterium]